MRRATPRIFLVAMVGLPLLVIGGMIFFGGKAAPKPAAPIAPPPVAAITLPPPSAARDRIVLAGREVFFAKGCWRCHSLGDENLPGRLDAVNVGPDLSAVGGRLSLLKLQQSLLAPNAEIAEPREKHTINGISRMPPFPRAGFMGDELRDLVLFLQQLNPSVSKARPVAVTDATFAKEVLQAKGLVLVDFWAEWCAPCRVLTPILDDLAVEFAGRVTIRKVNIDNNPALVKTYRPEPIPCMILFLNGKEIDRQHGLGTADPPKVSIAAWLKKNLPQP